MSGYAFPEGTESAKSQEEPDPTSLLEAVHLALERSGVTLLRRVVAVMSGGKVSLRGTVPSFYLKQMAQETVMAVPGVGVVRNELQVGGGR